MKTPQNTRQTRIKPSFIAYLSRSLALATLAAMGLGQANAANLDWDPAISGGVTLGGAGTWDTTLANWYDGAADVVWPNLTTDTAIFGGTAGGLVTINTGAGVNAGNLTFNTTGYTLAGNVPADVLTLGAGVVTVTNGADTATVSAVVGGTSGLSKAGAGTLVLSGVNTYTGVTNVNGGVLRANQGVGLGAGNLSLNGGVLETGVAFSRAVGTAAGEVAITGGASGFSAFGAPVTVNLGGAAATLVWGSANFAPTTLVLNAATANNALTFSNGLDLNNTGSALDRTVSVGANTATIGGAIINSSGAGGLVKSGAGALVLSGINTYSGATTINQGTVQIGAATGLGDASATNTIALGGGALRSTATMDLGATRTIAVGAGGGALSAQTGTVLTVSGTLGGTGTLSAAGGGTVVLSANNSGFGGNMTVDSVGGNTTNTTLRLSNANALTSGTVTVNPGLAAAGGNGNQVELAGVSIGSSVNLVLNTVNASNSRSTLLGGSGTSTWSGGIQFGGDGLAGLNASAGATLNVNGNITATGGGYTGTAFVRGAGTGVINGTITLPGASLAKTDGGTWTINSTGNTWLNTGVSVGTLRMGIANALPTATALTLGQNDANNATLDLNGFSQTIGSLATNPVTGLAGVKTVTSAAAATLTINGTANTTYAGVITGAGLGLIKQGAGIQTLTGLNTFAGGTTIDAGGALQLGDKLANNLVLAAGTAITNNGTLIFAPGATNLVYNNTITGNGNITLDGLAASAPAGITLSGANGGFTGSYTLNQGRMIFASQAAIGATTVPITVNGTTANGGQLWVNGNFSVANPITLNGYGALEATGLLGAIRFNTGTYAGAISLGSNASVNPQGTAATISGNITGGVGAQLLYGVPGAAQNGSVTISSPGGNTYAGGTLVRLGTGALNANVANAVGSGTLQIDSGTVILNTASALGSAPVALNGGTLRLQAQNTSSTAGVNGLNATYFNFGSNPGIASAQFAGDTLFLNPRSFSRVDAGVNMPQAGASGGLPIVPVAGYSQGGAGAVNNGALWKGLLNITTAGSYQFKGNNDDNLVLYIDGVQIGALGVVSALTNIGSAVTLSAGAHSIVVKHTNGAGGGYARVLYNGGAGSDAPADEVLGTDAGSVTTGSLNAIDLGAVAMTASSTLDLLNDATTSSLSLGNGTLTITSQTLNKLTVSGATITAATPTLAVQSDTLTFTGAIGESSAGLGLNIAGPGLTEFQATNNYTGTTTVTAGQLRLSAVAGNSIAGNLTLNAANANGDIANVRLTQANQIADTATVTMTQGILDIGANNDTIASLTSNGGRIIGGGTLTVANLGASTLTGGAINVSLAGAGGLNKTGTGTLALGGAVNTYTGVTAVTAGTLLLNASTLGAGGAGNETNVSGTGQLLINGSNLSGETINVDVNTGLRVAGGTSTIGTLNFTAGATAPVLTAAANGELILNAAPTSTANITKDGAGTLTFNYNVGATLPTNVIHSAGNLGFNGTQSFGAATIGSGRGFKFNSDPLASGGAVDVTAPNGTTVIAGYAAANELLPAINGASTGSLALGVNSSANLDFSSDASLSLGAVGLRTYSGTITPGASGYRLGGGGGTLTLANPLTGTNALTIDEAGVVDPRGVQTFTGAISVDGSGSTLRVINNHQLGNAANGLTLSNGGTLQLIGSLHNAATVGSLFHQVGNVLSSGARTITIGSGGGTIDTNAHQLGGNFQTLSGVNALTGTGTLTKTGYGELILLSSSNFSGDLVIGSNGGRIQVRAGGDLPNVNSVTVGQSGEFLMHNNGALGTRQFPEASDADRLRDGAQINLLGGSLFYIGNDAITTNEQETVGNVVLGVGRNQIQINKGGGTGTQGAQLNLTNLTRSVGGGVLHIAGTLGTLGTPTGDHARINPLLLNGAALPAATANGVTLPWATTTNAGNFAAVSVTGLTGIVDGPSTSVATATLTPVAGTRYTFTPTVAAQTITLTAGNQQMSGLRFVTNLATPTLAFTNAVDTLFLQDGVVIGDNNAQVRSIGLAALRGNITAGGIGAAAGAKELFFHQNQSTLAVESVIVDNNGAVTVHKGVGGGTLELRALNTYSGGTIVHSGRINAIVAGSLGSGAVTVKGAAIELRAPGTTSSTSGFTITDSSELFLQSPTGVYNQPGDRFTLVGPGNMLTGSIANAGQGLASVTRVNTITGAGQVVIPAGTHIRYQGTPNGVVDFRGPQNLGTNADLYFNLAGSAGGAQSITIGAGTPWKGLGSSVGTGWDIGTINANSDFTIQGLNRVGGNVAYALGAVGGVGGSYTINNLSGGAINAFLDGRVDMNEDTPMVLPSNLTYVAMPGSYVVPTYSQQFGYDTLGQSRASLVAQAGSTIDPGNFVPVGAAANMPQGMPYSVPSPVNTFATFEAGSRFLINDASGIGSTTGGATWTMKADSITHIQNAAAFLGSNAGLINAGQFVYEPGAIVRYDTGRVFKHDQFINNESGGKRTVLEIFNGNRDITDAVNPFVVIAPGSPTVEAMTLTFGNGGMITNDSADRTINERRGGFALEDGAVLAATSQTFLNIQENVSVLAGATINVGSTKYVDGNPKNGLIQLTGPQSNVFGAGAKLVVLDGSALGLAATNTFPDTTPIELPAAVTNVAPAGAVGFNPGNGSTLLPNVANFAEIVGHVTGDGSVIANAAGTYLGINATSNFTSNIRFRNANAQQANLWKVGSSDMTLTNSSDSVGIVFVGGGKLILSGAGNTAFAENRVQKGGTLELDNTATALSNRLGGSVLVANALNKSINPMGGTLSLIGNATTAVEERFANLFNSAGNAAAFQGVTGYTTLKITPGAATTNILVNSAENFQNAGIAQQRSGTWVINSPTVANLPITFSTAGNGGIIVNGGNTSNGYVQIASPNFVSLAGTFGTQAGGTYGAAGTTVAPTRPDYLGDANNDGNADGFMTEDGVFLGVTNTNGTAILTGLPTTTGLTAGMLVQGSVPNGTRILSVDSTTQVTLTANTTAAAVNMQFISGGMRNLAASEYSSTFRNNQNVGINVKLSGTTSTSGDTRISTLTMTPGSTLNITGALPYTESLGRLHLNGGGIFVQSGAASTINGGTSGGSRNFLQANGGSSLFLHTQGDLNLNAMVFTDNAVVKTGPGTLNVGPEAFNGFRGSLQIDGGIVNLGTGNSMSSIRQTNGSTSNNHLYLNAGTLNLNGNSQMINTLNNNNELPGMGGTVTSTTAATLTITGGGRFSGIVDGAISIDKNANNTLLLTNAQSYSGSTLVRAGTLSLRDSAVLAGTSGVTVSHATLQFDNSYLSNVANRIPAATPVSLYGATLNITGAAGQVASQTFNNLTLAGGLTTFTSNAGGGGANEINIGNLIRPAGSGAVLNFQQNYGFVGTAGNTTTAIRNFITNVNGSPLALNDGIIGGWAIVNGDNFATYRPATGVGALANTEDGFAGYESGDATTALATQNVNDGAARTFAASKTINSWRMAPGAAITNTYNDGVGLTIDSGGLLGNSNFTVSHNAAANSRNNFITSNSGELDYFVNQNTHGINIPITGSIDLVKSGGGALNLNPSTLLTATAIAGTTITLANTAGLEVGDPISGGTTSTYPAGTVITAITPGVSITTNNPVTAVGATLDVRNTFGNTYTGKTIVNGGTLTLNQSGASQTALAIPGDLVITNAAVVTEANVVGQFKNNANITLVGGGRVNFLNAAGVTETIGSLTFLDGVSGTATSNVDRTALQLTSIINLSSPTAITATNTNPSASGMPFIGGFAGTVGFTNSGGSTLNINSPTAVSGVLATGLSINARIGSVPTGVSEGGLIKSGNGLLTLRPDQNQTFGAAVSTTSGSNVISGLVGAITGIAPLRIGQMVTSNVANAIPANSYIVSIDSDTQIKISQNSAATSAVNTVTGLIVNEFGNPTSLTDVFNIQSGTVRADTSGALGSNFANTTVQNGAVLLGANNASQVITGSITLKNGSTLGATISSFIHGAATLTAANQSVLNVPSGNVHVAAYDYYVPSTNNGNITFNGRVTGAGNINIYGPQITQGNGGGGAITLGNPILTGTGSNNYSGTISVGPNSVLANQVALIAASGITRTTGNVMGTATINLDGGRLRLRDDASATADVNATTVTYGNNVTLSRNSWIDANRQTSTTAVNNIINLGTLTVSAGTKVLNVDSGNGYQIGITSLDGPGTFIKAGGSRLNINGIAPTFSGNIGIAGPVGIVVAPTFNTTTTQNLVLPTTANLNNFSVAGLYMTEASKTLNIAGTLSVDANPGSAATGQANQSGRLGITNTTTIAPNAVVNNGVVGPLGGAVTLTAPGGFSGSGIYQTTSATAGATTTNPLTLAGNVTAGILRTAGTGTVTVTGAAHTPSGAEVQGGTLKLAPTTGVTSTGTIKVIGVPASVASGTTAPISAVTGTLEFAPVTTATHTGNITNSGVVKVVSGTTTVTGVIAGSATTQYVPGLLEGLVMGTTGFTVDNTRPANPGNFGVQMEPRMLQPNVVTQQALTGHLDNEVWVYNGYVKDDDGVFSFAGNQDDNLGVWVDGVNVINAGGNVVASSAHKMTLNPGNSVPNANGNGGTPSQNFGAGIAIPGYGTGWHLVEIRMRNGTGGAGPWTGNSFTTNYGFGYKNGIGALDGADYIKPIDDGTGSLFLTALGGKGDINLADGTTLNAGGFQATKNVVLNSIGNTTNLNVTAAGSSDADSIQLTGTTATAIVALAANANVTTGNLSVVAGGALSLVGDAGSSMTVTATQTLDGSVTVDAGTLNIQGVGAGTGIVTLNDGVLNLTGSLSGSVVVNGGILTGSSASPTTGSIAGITDLIGGTLKPGSATTNATGILNFDGGLNINGASAAFDLNGTTAGTGFDQLNVTTLTLGANVPFTLSLGFAPAPMTSFVLVDADSVARGAFEFSYAANTLSEGETFFVGANEFTFSYVGGNGNDPTVTFVVPEPGSAALLLGGLAMLAGRRRRKQA